MKNKIEFYKSFPVGDLKNAYYFLVINKTYMWNNIFKFNKINYE